MTEQAAGSLETPADAGKGEAGEVARWLLELNLASKAEEKWRKKAAKVVERYRDESDRTDWKFNILWSNTEVLRPHLYSNTPKASVRRRFADADPVGKAAAEVIERALDYSLETTDFDAQLTAAVLDYVLPGRAVARVRFEPSFDQGGTRMAYARCRVERVDWRRFRRGPGTTWQQVPWIAYEHELTKGEVGRKFPGTGGLVGFDVTSDGIEDAEQERNPDVFKRVRVWEIRDRKSKEVLYLAPTLKDRFLAREPDALNLEGFLDCAAPLYAVDSATSLVPIPEYEMYRDQARELDRVTVRIARIVNTLKVRGIYDATVNELKNVITAGDNELVPVTSPQAMASGGMEKAVWIMPIDKAAVVLQQLIQYREQVKATIYEIMGIGDILRGMSDPDETLGAQQLKAQTGSLRLQRRQRDVQRFIRDLLRKKAEIIAENYTPELLALMTGVQLFPTAADKQVAAQQAQVASQTQQPVPPDTAAMLGKPTWEEVMGVLRNDLLRSFRIDIETDSTVAADEATEREQMTQLIQGLGGFAQAMTPVVESGLMPAGAAQAVMIALVRKFKLGKTVEDEMEKAEQAPRQEQPDPAAVQVQAEQQKAQAETEMKQQEVDASIALQQKESAARTQEAQARFQMDAQKQEADRLARQAEIASAAALKDKELVLAHEATLRRIDREAELKREAMRYEIDLKQRQAELTAQVNLEGKRLAAESRPEPTGA